MSTKVPCHLPVHSLLLVMPRMYIQRMLDPQLTDIISLVIRIMNENHSVADVGSDVFDVSRRTSS
jgi:hypothetical protein